AGVAGAAFAVRRYRRRRPRGPRTLARALGDADHARRVGNDDLEQRALGRALRAGLEGALPSPGEGSGFSEAPRALSAEELAQRVQGDPTLSTAAELLIVYERAR